MGNYVLLSCLMNYWLFRFFSFLRWYRSAKTRYDIHSPHVSAFLAQVVEDDRQYHAFGLVRQIRKWWSKQAGVVDIVPIGATSKIDANTQRPIAELISKSAVSFTTGKQLFRIALWCKAQYILELGTNAGISTLYLYSADRRAQLHTIEGNVAIAGLASKTFEIARVKPNLRQHVGTFEESLNPVLAQLPQVDLLFIDGDHRYEPTLAYVQKCLPKRTESSLFIIADIHWSVEMERAWEELKNLAEVTASVDLYQIGILFFHPGISPDQHLAITRAKWKPWRMGLWA